MILTLKKLEYKNKSIWEHKKNKLMITGYNNLLHENISYIRTCVVSQKRQVIEWKIKIVVLCYCCTADHIMMLDKKNGTTRH